MEPPQTFYESLHTKSDSDLTLIAFGGNEYTQEAQTAAQVELKQRGFTAAQFAAFRHVAEVEAIEASSKRDQSLSWGERILCLLIPGAGLLLFAEFRHTGYSRRANEAGSYAVLHLVLFTAYHFRHVLN